MTTKSLLSMIFAKNESKTLEKMFFWMGAHTIVSPYNRLTGALKRQKITHNNSEPSQKDIVRIIRCAVIDFIFSIIFRCQKPIVRQCILSTSCLIRFVSFIMFLCTSKMTSYQFSARKFSAQSRMTKNTLIQTDLCSFQCTSRCRCAHTNSNIHSKYLSGKATVENYAGESNEHLPKKKRRKKPIVKPKHATERKQRDAMCGKKKIEERKTVEHTHIDKRTRQAARHIMKSTKHETEDGKAILWKIFEKEKKSTNMTQPTRTMHIHVYIFDHQLSMVLINRLGDGRMKKNQAYIHTHTHTYVIQARTNTDEHVRIDRTAKLNRNPLISFRSRFSVKCILLRLTTATFSARKKQHSHTSNDEIDEIVEFMRIFKSVSFSFHLYERIRKFEFIFLFFFYALSLTALWNFTFEICRMVNGQTIRNRKLSNSFEILPIFRLENATLEFVSIGDAKLFFCRCVNAREKNQSKEWT